MAVPEVYLTEIMYTVSAHSPFNKNMQTVQILVVEDDLELNTLVAGRLREAGYDVETARTGREAIDRVEMRPPDLVLLDVMLPEIDGLEVCRRLRANHPLIHIIMLTARSDELDRVIGLEVGADDYVTKPFSLQEVVARVRAAFRRIRLTEEQALVEAHNESEKPLSCDGLYVDPIRREVRLREDAVHLTVREFDLLVFLAHHPNRPYTRMQLLDKVWNIQYEGYDRTVDSHVQRLRSKIESDPGSPRYIRTVWGVGYKFQMEEAE